MTIQETKENFGKEFPEGTRILVFEGRGRAGKFFKSIVSGKPYVSRGGMVFVDISQGMPIDIVRIDKDPEVAESEPHTYLVSIIFHDGDETVKCFNTEYAPTTDQIIVDLDLHDIDTITVYRKEKRLKIKQQISEE